MEKTKKTIMIIALIAITLVIGYVAVRELRKRNKLPPALDNLLPNPDNNNNNTENPNTPTGGDVVVTISNPQDPELRDICFFKTNPLPYKGGGVYNTPKIAELTGVSGDTRTFTNLPSGTYWFIVGGMPQFGGWSGTIKFSNGTQQTFSGVNIEKAIQVTIP
ncbi:MAG: hypothetical protein FWC33_06090 [Candidatus Bathyarchaeota archaeon]|nr:hypothetical protein [Candidatus Termiticorpusculum sp.]